LHSSPSLASAYHEQIVLQCRPLRTSSTSSFENV
jgi:hypothetical protein